MCKSSKPKDELLKMPWLLTGVDFPPKSAIPRAILFYGKEGIGKFVIAKSLAKKILCQYSPNLETACDDCKDCHMVKINAHPDLVILPDQYGDRAKVNVEEIRGLLNFATKSSHRGQSKIVILNKADQLSHHAGNAVLKLLEDDQNNTFYFLIAEKLSEVIPTIRSRCLKNSIKQPSKAVALKWLSENTKHSADNLSISLAISGFAPLKAKDLLGNKEFWDNRTNLLTAMTDHDNLERFLAIGEKMEPSLVANILLMLAFDILLYQSIGQIRYNSDHESFISNISKTAIRKTLFEWYSSIIVYSKQASHGLNNRLALEALFLSSPI